MLKHFHKILKEPLPSIFLLLHKKICNFIQLQLESFYCIYFHKIKSESALFYKSDCFCLLVCFISLMFILSVSTLQCWLLQLFPPLDKTFSQVTSSELGLALVPALTCIYKAVLPPAHKESISEIPHHKWHSSNSITTFLSHVWTSLNFGGHQRDQFQPWSVAGVEGSEGPMCQDKRCWVWDRGI